MTVNLTNGMISAMAETIAQSNRNKAAYVAQITSGKFEGKFVGFNFRAVGVRSAMRMTTNDPAIFKNSLPFENGKQITEYKIVKVRNAKEI